MRIELDGAERLTAAADAAGNPPATELRRAFAEQGFVVVPGFLAPAEIDDIAADLCWLVETQLDLAGGAPGERGGDAIRRLSRALIDLVAVKPEAQAWIYDEVNRQPFMFALASEPRLLALVRELLSDRVAIHPRLNIVMSSPGEEWHLAPWHQDGFYGPALHLVAYLPLQPTDARNGGLMVAPGQHRQGLRPHGRHDHGVASKFLTIAPEEVAGFPERRQLRLDAGDLLLFDRHLPHSAAPNRSRDVRFAITIRYSDQSDPFFAARGWQWRDLAEDGLRALARQPTQA
ncbi:MAG: phytanoyl-CoA dioxygenase family protein [Dongiaceae bacterium]